MDAGQYPGEKGIKHLGIQAESEEELEDLRTKIGPAHGLAREEGKTACC